MSKADEMLGELGYKKDIHVDYGLIRYNKNDENFIRFIIEDKAVEVNSIENNDVCILSIDMRLLEAINEKCRELGWLDDYQELGKDLASNFIAKEVIREKLEELKENLNTVEHYETVGAIRILKEILEGEKK